MYRWIWGETIGTCSLVNSLLTVNNNSVLRIEVVERVKTFVLVWKLVDIKVWEYFHYWTWHLCAFVSTEIKFLRRLYVFVHGGNDVARLFAFASIKVSSWSECTVVAWMHRIPIESVEKRHGKCKTIAWYYDLFFFCCRKIVREKVGTGGLFCFKFINKTVLALTRSASWDIKVHTSRNRPLSASVIQESTICSRKLGGSALLCDSLLSWGREYLIYMFHEHATDRSRCSRIFLDMFQFNQLVIREDVEAPPQRSDRPLPIGHHRPSSSYRKPLDIDPISLSPNLGHKYFNIFLVRLLRKGNRELRKM